MQYVLSRWELGVVWIIARGPQAGLGKRLLLPQTLTSAEPDSLPKLRQPWLCWGGDINVSTGRSPVDSTAGA